MKKMKRIIIALGLSLFAASIGADAQALGQRRPGPAVAIPANISALLSAYPHGGEGLSSAVENLLKTDPSAARAVIALAKQGSIDQEASIVLGVMHALTEMEQQNQEGAKVIRAALRSADPTFLAMLRIFELHLAGQGGNVVLAGGHGDTFFSPGGGVGFAGGGNNPGRRCFNPSCN